MSISEFMTEQFVIIRDEIINGIPSRVFDSHEFIRFFSKRFETKYVEILSSYKDEPFRNVHSQIGKFLSEHQEGLKIKSIGTIMSKNIFGIDNSNEKWEKTCL
ncbi:hypothetical protein PbJCM13498_34920 [Prolixibacter bellariivorans]|uniref:Uncharacterized protein n=1 Tax=Prolixibacter bellariivorans TaxID=314319 RepID=A0A5M4B388_9BACT|nr:hypothetical protein [Prolixibacter bellariivorans]GET34629.1 hypothetical protein PbJCM13498_34920 [Prolixibacter bellariivorans]